MSLFKKIIILFSFFLLHSCATYEVSKNKKNNTKKYFSSNGFAMIYEDNLFKQGLVNKKVNNKKIRAMHSFLKANTPIKIINPENNKSIKTKVYKKANYPKIFNIVITKEIANLLDLDLQNPYVEVVEFKKNKTFIAKESNIFEEEKQVANTAPVDEIKMDDLSSTTLVDNSDDTNKNKFILVISDFYYYDSANNLKKELQNKTNIKNFSIEKINANKYRLSVGPYENFNSLKLTYISLNNLGFDDLNIYKK